MAQPAPSARPPALTVSELNRAASRLLGDCFFNVWVQGELSNLSVPSSGHWYFSLKDANAQIRCALFKNQQRRLVFRPENGKQVLVQGQVGLYEPRGDYQLIVHHIEDGGDGALRRAYEALKARLADEGLFDPRHKKPLPTLPRRIGVVTSPTGAALKDILTVLNRRFPAIPVVVYPASVQGGEAAAEIVRALAAANADRRCDLLIVGRGGGSLEDLAAFNDEAVARAIHGSAIPVIAAVGHETDVTIADFVADVRAATPSAAAELAVPDQAVWLRQFQQQEHRLRQALRLRQQRCQQQLDWLHGRLQRQHPSQRLLRHSQRLDELEARLRQALGNHLRRRQDALATQTARLWRHHPGAKLAAHRQRHGFLSQRLGAAMGQRLAGLRQRLAQHSQTLHTLSPLATLGRGYALVTLAATGDIVRSARQVQAADTVEVLLADGRLRCQVEQSLAAAPAAVADGRG